MWQLVTLVVLVTAYSLVGLVAVWGALGRGHWFLRVSAVLLFLAPWLAAPDYRIWVAFLVQSAIVLVALLSIRRLRASADVMRPTFSLHDLFLLILAAGVVLAILARAWASMQSQWLAAFIPGVLFALFTLMAVWAVEGARRAWVRLAMLTIFFPGCLMGAWLWLARSARGRFGRAACVTCLLLISAPPAAFYFWLVSPQFVSLPAPPAENGMDDLLRAAEMVATPAVDVNALSGEALQTYLERNRPALNLARSALARPCQMTLPADGAAFQQRGVDRFMNLRQLSRVLAAAGRNQVDAGNLRDAARHDFEAVQLGDAMTHGGAMLHAIAGAATQMAGLEGLRQLLPQLDDAACEELAARLAELEARQETFDQIMARELIYFRKYRPWGERWILLQVPEMFEESRRVSEASFNRGLANLRLFRCHLALREYWLAHAAYPKALAELSPQFLADLPADPFSGRSLIYRRLPDGYQMYSVGEDGIDDGGKPAPPGAAGNPAQGDVMLDVPFVTGDERS